MKKETLETGDVLQKFSRRTNKISIMNPNTYTIVRVTKTKAITETGFEFRRKLSGDIAVRKYGMDIFYYMVKP